jgi:nucleoredoxin
MEIQNNNQELQNNPVNPEIMKSIFYGKKFINNKFEEVPCETILRCKIICLFFTAQWCSPCNILAKDLIKLYEETNQGQKLLEIIHISADKNEAAFKADIVDKPWVFLPYNDPFIKEIVNKLNVYYVPVFLLVDKDLNILSDNCRKELVDEGPAVSERWLQDLEKSGKI